MGKNVEDGCDGLI